MVPAGPPTRTRGRLRPRPPAMSLSFALPNGWSSARRVRTGQAACRLAWVKTRNGSLRSRHLLPTLALLAAANPNSVLNAKEIEAFSQVQTVLNSAVASS